MCGEDVRQLRMYDVVGCGPALRDHISDRQILPPVKAGDLIALLGHVEEYKEAFIDRGGIELLTRLFQAHRRELTFVPFLTAFLAVLPSACGRAW